MQRLQHLFLSMRWTIAPVQSGLSVAILFLVILASAFLGPGAAALEAPPVFLTKWGTQGSGDGQFINARGVAVDGAGNVYVADYNNNRIQKFDSAGAFLTKWGTQGSGDGQFIGPRGVAVDGAGNVYVADEGNHRVQKFDSAGAFLTKWGGLGSGDGQFIGPFGVAVDGSGNVYVADTSNQRIQKFTLASPCPADTTEVTSGVCFVTKWGSFGSGDGQFNFPNGVAVDSSGNVYVADASNQRIQKFTLASPCPADTTEVTSGVCFVTKWGSLGTGDGQFNSPIGVAVDGAGNVYVADRSNHRIQKFDSAGAFLTKWGSLGSGDGQFSNPFGVAVDGAGNVYVADTGNSQIQKFGPPPPDHFLCYKGKVTTGFQSQVVTLKDQFDDVPQTVTVKKPASLCNPAEKTFDGNVEPINDPNTHLLGYKIKQQALHEPVTAIIVKNQLHPDGLSVDTIKPDRLLVPTAKDLLDPVPEPDPDTHSVDHLKCYKVKVTPGTAKLPKGIQASVKDQFNEVAKLFDIKKPSRLCNPVDKNGEGIKNPQAHLMCYKAKPAAGEPKHIPLTGIHVNNQFGPEQLDTIKEEELCVPSEKILGGG